MSGLERSTEVKYLDFCLANRILCKKLRLSSESSWPDRTLLYKGHTMFMELKRKGERPTPLQKYTLDTLTAAGFVAVWADNLEQAVQLTSDWKNHVDSSNQYLASLR